MYFTYCNKKKMEIIQWVGFGLFNICETLTKEPGGYTVKLKTFGFLHFQLFLFYSSHFPFYFLLVLTAR